jgi:zinc-ribbon domain
MSSTCPRCNAVVDANSQFCTNCGAVLGAQAPYQQVESQPQVPSWATSNPGGVPYQQQSMSGQGISSMGGSLGFGSQNDVIIKKVLTAIVATILGTLVLLILFGFLAALIPGLRCAFLVIILLIILVPWLIYVNLRRYVRRTVGRLWWFL